MKKVFVLSLVVLALALVLLLLVVWWAIVTDYSIRTGVVPVLVNVLTVTFATVLTYLSAVERDEQKFRRELLDKFLDDAGHWAYFPEGIETLKNKTREGYFAGLCARYHRVRAGIEDLSDLEEFGHRWDEFKNEAECYKKSSPKDGKRLEEAIWGMTDFLRSHYLK